MVVQKPLVGRASSAEGSRQQSEAKKKSVETKTLQLLILTQFFPPDFAATGQLIEELAGQLGEQGVEVKVFTGQPGYAFAEGDAPQTEKKGRVWVKRSRTTQLFSKRIRAKAVNGVVFSLRAIWHLAKRSRRYVVMLVTTAPPFLPLLGFLANLFFGLPYVCLLYDLYPDIAVELDVVKQNHPLAVFWRWVNRLVWRRAANIIVLRDSMKNRIVSQCPAVEERISVIHSWADDEQIVPMPKEENWFAREHGLVDKFVVMYSGNMGRCHDIDTLFRAACLLRDEPILFVCVGGGAKRDALMADVAAEGLENFQFLPYQEKSVLPYSLTAADVAIVSVAEGMEELVAPSKLYSAMAAGSAIGVICPTGSYIGALLRDPNCGASFDNGEAQPLAEFIRGLTHDRKKAEQLGRSGRAYLETHFTPKIISDHYLAVIKSVVSQSPFISDAYHQ
ncbi:MAG: glycosyltransferase family 4 protein [Phormidesmis sp.]